MSDVNKQLLDALKSVTLTQEDIDMGRAVGDEQHATARQAIAAAEQAQKVGADLIADGDTKNIQFQEPLRSIGMKWIAYAKSSFDSNDISFAIWSAMKDAIAHSGGDVPNCPFPCGWQQLHAIAVKDGAYIARAIDEDEPVTAGARQAAVRASAGLIAVCRAMLAAVQKGGA